MLEAWDNFRGTIVVFFESHGFDIVYVTTAFMLALCLIALKKAKDWDRLDDSDRFLLKSVFFATAVTVVICVFHLAGVF